MQMFRRLGVLALVAVLATGCVKAKDRDDNGGGNPNEPSPVPPQQDIVNMYVMVERLTVGIGRVTIFGRNVKTGLMTQAPADQSLSGGTVSLIQHNASRTQAFQAPYANGGAKTGPDGIAYSDATVLEEVIFEGNKVEFELWFRFAKTNADATGSTQGERIRHTFDFTKLQPINVYQVRNGLIVGNLQ